MLRRVRGESLIISARQRGPTDRAKAKHKDFALHLESRSSLSPAVLTSHVSNCVGGREERSQSVLLSCLLFFPAPLSLSDHNHNYFLSLAVFFLKLLQLRCASMLTRVSILGRRNGLNPIIFMEM